jgi:hypothetical protein
VRRILEPTGYDVVTAPCCGPVAMDVFHNTNQGLSFSMFVCLGSRVKIFVVRLGATPRVFRFSC